MQSNVSHLSIEEFNKLFPVGTVVHYYPLSFADHYTGTRIVIPASIENGKKVVGLDIGEGVFPLDNIRIELE